MPEAGRVDAAKLEVYADAAGEWRWRARDTNGEVVADSGEGYVEFVRAEQAGRDLFPDAELFVPNKEQA